MHILYNIAGLYRPAGMERVLTDKAGWLVAHGHKVTILTTEQKGRRNAFPLDPRIETRDLAVGYEDNNGSRLLVKLLRYPVLQRRHRKALEAVLAELKPDITVSMFDNDVNLIPQMRDGSRKVLEVHFSRFKRLQYGRRGLWALADRIRTRMDSRLVRKYDRFVVLTEEDKPNWGPMETIRVIANPVFLGPDGPAPLDTKTVTSVGRYCHQKGFERLIEAWGLITRKTGWTLRIVGDGELRPEMERQIASLGLQESVLLGRNSDMAGVYRNASVLAVSSRYEGLSMALVESQTFGVPAVSFDCKCGPREIIRDGENGFLVPEGDVRGLAEALQKLIDDDGLRIRMGLSAYGGAGRWSPEVIMPQWIRLFEEIL